MLLVERGEEVIVPRFIITVFDLEAGNYDGLIAVDNTLWSGKVIDENLFDDATKAIRGFNAKVIDDRRVSVSLVPIGDGLTLLRKE